MRRPGSMVGSGRTAEVFDFGAANVVKVLRPGVPDRWAAREFAITRAVHAIGVPTPAVREVVSIDGRPGIVFERIDGPSMWQAMVSSPAAVEPLTLELATLQRSLHALTAPEVLPSLTKRVSDKLDQTGALSPTEAGEARRTVAGLGDGTSLYHGDLHPGNILMSAKGPIIIDWFDAAAGPSVADIVRTSLLVRPSATTSAMRPHLPGATGALLSTLHRCYLQAVLEGESPSAEVLRSWEAIMAASRLAERAQPNEEELLGLWRCRNGAEVSPLIEELLALELVAGDDDRPASGRPARRRR